MKTSINAVFLICIILIFKYIYSNQVETITISNNGLQQEFLVRSLSDKYKAAHMLCTIKNKLIRFSKQLLYELESKKDNESIEYYPYVKIICKRLDKCPFKEASANSSYTSYTVNKGTEMVVCLRDKKTNKLHDLNTLMYVCTHEIGHIGCPEVGHTKLFHRINKFLLLEAIKQGVYTYTNYKYFPCDYCGLILDNTIIDNDIIV